MSPKIQQKTNIDKNKTEARRKTLKAVNKWTKSSEVK